ncbi:von willebrand factor domain protein [Salix suchowensis]|nr:von willebrand factor domain protein [Salix suchowensis]
MDGGNGWHVIGGAAAGAQACDRAGAQDKTIINRILHRFRPIAPKPATGNDLDSSSSVFDIKKMLASKTLRRKRKYVRVRKSNKLKKNKRVSGVPSSDQEKEGEGEGEGGDLSSSVTLQLLPEGSESKDGESQERIGKTWYNQTFVMLPQKRETTVAESWVTVECVTDSTCMDERAVLLGCTDVERMRNLEEDTCPGFISDGLNHVQWMNGAYRKMVETARKEVSKERVQLYNTAPEVMVRLVIKEKLLRFVDCASAFSCWVRLQNSWQKEKCSKTAVPCDVWRMDFGGFAWRLDVDSALSLGR